MGLTNADSAFTLYYVRYRAAAPKVRVSCFIHWTYTYHFVCNKTLIDAFFFFQSLIEQIEQRAEKIPEWVVASLQNKRALFRLYICFWCQINPSFLYIDVDRYHQLLDEIHQCYLDQRDLLLSPSITSTITDLTKQNSKDHCALVRHDWFKARLIFMIYEGNIFACKKRHTMLPQECFLGLCGAYMAVHTIHCTAGTQIVLLICWINVQSVVYILCNTSSIKQWQFLNCSNISLTSSKHTAVVWSSIFEL